MYVNMSLMLEYISVYTLVHNCNKINNWKYIARSQAIFKRSDKVVRYVWPSCRYVI